MGTVLQVCSFNVLFRCIKCNFQRLNKARKKGDAMTYKEEQELAKDIIKVVKVGTRCKMDNKTYEVVEIYPYSDECNSPLYRMIVIDKESIEALKQELIRDNKRSKRLENYTEEELMQYRTISDIEPVWFITRKATILK